MTAEILTNAKYTIEKTAQKLEYAVVSESGASVYSASEIAREELPELDVTIRGAVSIARRWQDPLAELVKIDPKSIGVGQYQHDVDQGILSEALDNTVESVVNFVGVDLNTASYSLLRYVSGIGTAIARAIVEYRDKQGKFTDIFQLLNVPRLGAKVFQQAAGFLRIQEGENPLDNSAVHPESYSFVERLCEAEGVQVKDMIGNAALIDALNPEELASDDVGVPTIRDILKELKKPGRDPRHDYGNVGFSPNVMAMEDLEEGMILNGVVTNVTHFGAFVDIGVHQDGLVHISEMATKFVRDPTTVCKVGNRVKVKVISLDMERKRIGLSMSQAEGQ